MFKIESFWKKPYKLVTYSVKPQVITDLPTDIVETIYLIQQAVWKSIRYRVINQKLSSNIFTIKLKY